MRPKMAPKCLPGGAKIAPKSLQNGSRRPPESGTPFLTPFCRLLGGSWGAPGALLAFPGAVLAPLGALLGAPGGHFGLPGVSFWSFVGHFGKLPWKIAKTLKKLVFSMVFDGFGPPRGVQNRAPNGSEIAVARVLATLGAHWALLGAVLASLGGLLALLEPLGRLLGRSCSDFSSKGKPGYRGTGSAFKARAASTARKARAARAARTGRARAPVP